MTGPSWGPRRPSPHTHVSLWRSPSLLLLLLVAAVIACLPSCTAQGDVAASAASFSSGASSVTATVTATSAVNTTATPTPTPAANTSVPGLDFTAVPLPSFVVPTTTMSAAKFAPTITIRNSTFYQVVTLNKTTPVVVLQYAEELSRLSTMFFLTRSANDIDDLPTMLVSTTDPYFYVLGSGNVPDPTSGGTRDAPNVKNSAADAWQVSWDQGFGNWTYGRDPDQKPARPSIIIGRGVDNSAMFDPTLVGQGNLQVYISSSVDPEASSESIVTPDALYFGDTTGTQALLFSPLLLAKREWEEPVYPNYTLPPADMKVPTWSESVPDDNPAKNRELAVVIVPTASGQLHGLGYSLIALAQYAASITDSITSPGSVVWTTVQGQEGFRFLWTVDGLAPSTNYTALMLDFTRGSVSDTIYFATKEASFDCPLVAPTDICPGIAYASPIGNLTSSPLKSIPDAFANFITSNMQSFDTAVLTHACGRDLYSTVSTCLDCHNAYRDWLCRLVLPQCASSDPPPFEGVIGVDAPSLPMTIKRTLSNPRSDAITGPGGAANYTPTDYNELLPCLGTCTRVDRTCSAKLQWYCPHRNFNANESYAFITKENELNDGSASTGWPALDVWGNRWCNGNP